MAEVTNILRAYLAGILDADGFITIQKTFCGNPRYPLSYTYCEWVGCGQTSLEAVSIFHDIWGGSLLKRKQGKSHWRPFYYWLVTNKKAVRVIKELCPFLRVKKQQAELLLQLRQSKEEHHIVGKAVSPEVNQYREKLRQQIRELHDIRHSQHRLLK